MNALRNALRLFSVVFILSSFCIAQSPDTNFVRRSGRELMLNGKPFYAIGVNAYYLQNLAAYGDTAHLLEVLQSAKAVGINTIRTIGFFDSDDSVNNAVIQYAPGKYNEPGLQALDYVLAKAKEFSLRIIIPLVNNWDEYGGMNQYVEWFASQTPMMKKNVSITQQRSIYGAEGRKFRVHVTSSLTHDDFYRNDSIKQWYKNYMQTLLLRRNTFTNMLYKDDPTILSWELANEPRSLDPSGELVYQWLNEMSAFVKTIDPVHPVSSGEEGFDVSWEGYSHSSKYNQQSWLFDGTNGISFSKNLLIPAIDIASIHCYPSAWNLAAQSSLVWLKDHQQLADAAGKPLIYGEIGTRVKPGLLYEVVFNEAFHRNTSGVLLWQFTYEGRVNNDGYAFSCPTNEQICPVIYRYVYRFEQKREGLLSNPASGRLYANFPNPFNVLTVVSYDLSLRSNVKIEVFEANGRLVDVLVNEDQGAGYHQTLFDATNRSSGVYFVQMTALGNKLMRKIVLVK